MNKLKISQRIVEKLHQKHDVTLEEVEECFMNRTKGFLEDTREKHMSYPPTLWFIAETDKGRPLKVVFIESADIYEIKTAYEPNKNEVTIYENYA